MLLISFELTIVYEWSVKSEVLCRMSGRISRLKSLQQNKVNQNSINYEDKNSVKKTTTTVDCECKMLQIHFSKIKIRLLAKHQPTRFRN